MISIIAMVYVLGVIGLFVFIFAKAVSAVSHNVKKPLATPLIILLLLFSIGFPAYLLIQIQRTPPANAISDTININDDSQQLTLRSINMSAPTYEVGEGLLEKHYTSEVTVDVENSSDQELYLGMEYYADAGSFGFYSPGGSWKTEVLPVPPGWSGPLRFPLGHLRFVRGGSIKLTFAKCSGPPGEQHFDPSTRLFEKRYDMVAEE